MKTPEEIAQEIGHSTAVQECCNNPVRGKNGEAECCGAPDVQFIFTADTHNQIAAALAAERARADALAAALHNSLATISAVYQWLERVEDVGGATNLEGIAKCHAMLTSLRKNADRTEKLVMAPARAALAAHGEG